MSYLPSFILGYFCAQKRIQQKSSKTFKILLSVSTIAFAIYIFVCPEFPNIGNDILIRLLSYTIIVSLFVILSKTKTSNTLTKAITKLDKLSMGVYILNQVIINYILSIPPLNNGSLSIIRQDLLLFLWPDLIYLYVSLAFFNQYKWLYHGLSVDKLYSIFQFVPN